MIEKNIYLFCGDEEYLKDEKLKDLRYSYIEKTTLELNYNIFSASPTLDIKELIQTLKTLPFLNPKRMVVLKELETLSPSEQQSLLGYLKNPTPTTILVLYTDKNESNNSFVAEVSKYARVFRINKLNFSQLRNFIQKAFFARKKKISQDAIDLMIETVDNDLSALESYIEHISLFVGTRFVVERKDIESLAGSSITTSVFELVDVIIQKDPKKSVVLARQLIKSGKKIPAIISVLFGQFEKLFLAKLLLKNKLSKQALATKLGINKFFVEKFLGQVNSFTEEELKDKFGLILWADLKSKTQALKSDVILEILVTKLCLGEKNVDLLV